MAILISLLGASLVPDWEPSIHPSCTTIRGQVKWHLDSLALPRLQWFTAHHTGRCPPVRCTASSCLPFQPRFPLPPRGAQPPPLPSFSACQALSQLTSLVSADAAGPLLEGSSKTVVTAPPEQQPSQILCTMVLQAQSAQRWGSPGHSQEAPKSSYFTARPYTQRSTGENASCTTVLPLPLYFSRHCESKDGFYLFFMYYLCEEFYKPSTEQYCISNCVSWAPRPTLLDLRKKLDLRVFPDSSAGKESACNAGDPSPIPGLGRSSGEGNGCLLQHSGLENSMDRRAWRATVHWGAKGQTRLRFPHTHKGVLSGGAPFPRRGLTV